MKIKWTFETCKLEASKYNSRGEFIKKSFTAYIKSFKNKWLDEICSHMILKRKPKGYWTKERCLEISLLYKNITEFTKNNANIYRISKDNGWLDEICSHMILKTTKPKGYWNFENCKNEALKYNTKKEFDDNCTSAYNSALKNGWIDEICSHMILKVKPKGYWTKEKCAEEALKYNNKKDFSQESKGAYCRANKEKWLTDICKHMKRENNINRCIYSYEFSDNSVYVGLTDNIKIRNNQHKKSINSTVYKYSKKSKRIPILKQLTDFIDANKAFELEGFYVEEYRKNGWNILNVAKTGSLGGISIKWTVKKIIIEALKYNNKNDFYKNSSGAYAAARRLKILDKVCSHMIINQIRWTKESCQLEAIKYKSRSEFRDDSPSSYQKSLKNGWIDEICSHMIISQIRWTKEKIINIFLKYDLKYLRKYYSGAYKAAKRFKILNKFKLIRNYDTTL